MCDAVAHTQMLCWVLYCYYPLAWRNQGDRAAPRGDFYFYLLSVFALAFSVARLLAACCTLATSVFIFSASDL